MTNTSIKNTFIALLFIAFTSNVFAQSNTSSDPRLKIRLGFDSVENSHRQLLVTEDSNATPGIDFGYDGQLFENLQNDMFWMIENLTFVSQGIDVIDANTILPIGLYTGNSGINTILIDELVNVPEDLGIVIYDTETNSSHDIKNNAGFSIDLPAGNYFNRFELRFTDLNDGANNQNNTTSTEVDDTIEINYINQTNEISIQNTGLHYISSIKIYGLDGQLKAHYNEIEGVENTTIQAQGLKSSGIHVLFAETGLGLISKKINIK